MASRLRTRRQSIDDPPLFSDLLKELPQYAASFKRSFHRKRQRMRQIVSGLKKVAAEVKQMNEKSKKATEVISAAVGVGFVAAAAAALVTGRFSFTLLGVVALCVTAGAAVVSWTKKKTAQLNGSKKKVKEFLNIVESLRRELEKIKRVCEDLQRTSVGADTGNITRLRDNINELLVTTAKLQTSASLDCVTEVCDQCQKAVRELEKIKSNLSEFR